MNIKHHYLYETWRGMRRRCYSPTNTNYPYYGGRGITVCERWRNSFPNFIEDMGDRPPGHTLDRKDNDGNYEPSNCRWRTVAENNENRSTPRIAISSNAARCITRRKRHKPTYRLQVMLHNKLLSRTFSRYKEARDLRDLLEYEREFHRVLGL